MAVNWQLGLQPDYIGNAMTAFQKGRADKQQAEARNALATLVQNPGDQAAFGSLAQNDPEIALNYQKYQFDQNKEAASAADAARKRGMEAIPVTLRLLNAAKQNPAAYPALLQQARLMGVAGVENAPPQFDPAWVDSQIAILSPFAEPGKAEQLSGIARELKDAGYQEGTPQFAEAMRIAITGKYAPQYMDQNGDIRQSQLPPLPLPAPAAGAAPTPPRLTNEAYDFAAYDGLVKTLGPDGAAEFIRRNNVKVNVSSPEEAARLPKGTRYVTPDGEEYIL